MPLCGEKLVCVKVRCHKSLTGYLLERRWHPSQKNKKHKDGSLEPAFEVAGTKEIKTWILGNLSEFFLGMGLQPKKGKTPCNLIYVEDL
jgi:hypothetical protein